MKPLCVDLFAGLGGWSEGFLAEGWSCIGFDIERHDYGTGGYPGQLVIQDVLTIHGSQFRNADCIVASPPCQEFSYMAMPFRRGRKIAAALRGDGEFPEGYTGSRTKAELTALFDACFRIQREACETCTCGHSKWLHDSQYGCSGDSCDCERARCRYIPLVVENVKGAQPWVGDAKASYGSYFFWGDIETVNGNIVVGPLEFGANVLRAPSRTGGKQNPDGTQHPQGSWFKIADSKNRGSLKNQGFRFDGSGRSFQSESVKQHLSGPAWFDEGVASVSSSSPARKMASAMIAKIPFELSSHIARVYRPRKEAVA